ncbi:hypothetical protein KJK41_19610 [Bacillus haikouensis]|nr:hypothetical protein KJK41_19610 [Bacillus haikouensis]
MFKKRNWKAVVWTVVGLVFLSGGTMIGLSQTEKVKAEKAYDSLEGNLSSLYETMQTHMKEVPGNGTLTLMNEEQLASAQLSLNATDEQSLDGANKQKIEQELLPKLKGIEEYNRIVPTANQLQSRINTMAGKIKSNPLDQGLSKQFTSIKEELADFKKQTAKIETPSIKQYFQNRYMPQITRLEEQVAVYQHASNQINELQPIADQLSFSKAEFQQKVSELSGKVAELPYSDVNKGLQEKINTASKTYERNQLTAMEEKKRMEEKKKAEEERLAEEKRKAEEEKSAQKEYEEIFPMEFIEISPDGHKIINSRQPYNDESFYKYDEIAKKHGGRYYYTPSSDVAAIFNKERKVIASINYGFSTSLEYKELFVDLYVYYTGTPRDEAAKLVTKIIDSGETVEFGEGNGEGSRLSFENGRLHYGVW